MTDLGAGSGNQTQGLMHARKALTLSCVPSPTAKAITDLLICLRVNKQNSHGGEEWMKSNWQKVKEIPSLLLLPPPVLDLTSSAFGLATSLTTLSVFHLHSASFNFCPQIGTLPFTPCSSEPPGPGWRQHLPQQTQWVSTPTLFLISLGNCK
jgi:hypothetical protein